MEEFSERIGLKEQNLTLLGRDDCLEGEFLFHNDTIICGSLKGRIEVVEGHKIMVEPSGRMEGHLLADQIEIHGQFQGDLEGRKRVQIYPNSLVQGTVRAQKLEIHPGAIVEGEICANEG